MMELIEQLKSMRVQAQKRIERKRQIIKKQMHDLTKSDDAQLIKSLNPLINKLEQPSRDVNEVENTKIAKTFAVQKGADSDSQLGTQSLNHSNVQPQNVLPIHLPTIHSSQPIDSAAEQLENFSTDLVEQTAEYALANALNEVSSPRSYSSPNASNLISGSLALVGPSKYSPKLTAAQRTQFELEKIAAQLRETISQGRPI